MQEILLALAILLLTYLLIRWLKNPLRKIPGPPGLPILGNVLSLDVESMHTQLYDMVKKYGPVMKIYILNEPVVIISSTEACLEALTKRGTDFDGRPPVPRLAMIVPKDLVFSNVDDDHHPKLRRLFTKAMKAYGPGVAHLENIMKETVADTVDIIQEQDGRQVDIHELTSGYVCCVIASMLFGEKYRYNDPVCQSLFQLGDDILVSSDPVSIGAVFDIFPVLMNFKFFLSDTQTYLRDTIRNAYEFTQQKIDDAKRSFDKNHKRGCLDYFIEAQQEELDENGKPLVDDEGVRGLLIDFLVAGMETSHRTLSQAFLNLLHDRSLQKRLQEEIDSQFEPTHAVTLQDRLKLPLLEAYTYENLRHLSPAPVMLPHMTIRDTEVAGYKIPAHTRVIMNSFYCAHNPEVYDESFTLKPERFLDEEGKLVDAGHPARYKLLSFGAGRRKCPGELLAKSRIFLLLANILQKFDIEPAGELPDRDVRKYKMGTLIIPPRFAARFIRRQQ